jgi:replicative DNA helicase
MGKTAFCLNIARNAAVQYGIPVGVFSLEMASYQLAMRMLCSEARVDSHAVRTGKLPKDDWQKLSMSVGVLAESPIYIDDTPALSILEIKAKARRLKYEKNIGLLIVDYMQLVQGPPNSESRQQEISAISQALKALAKELTIPVIALSQLSRAVESRGGDRRPMLSDLRDSGAIEQDADVVIFIYRPEVYGRTEEEGIAEIIIGKQRSGPIGTIKLAFVKEYVLFANLSRIYEQQEYAQPF